MEIRLFLIIFLLFILLFGFSISGRRFSAPPIIFIVPFILQALESCLYYPWDISIITFSVIAIGSTIFCVACGFVHLLFGDYKHTKEINYTYVSNKKTFLLIFVTIICVIYIYIAEKNAISHIYSGNNISDTLGAFNDAIKSEGSDVSFTGLPSLMYNLLTGVAYVYAFLYARMLYVIGFKRSIPFMMLFLVGSLGIFVSGSRTGVIGPIISLIIFIILRNESCIRSIKLSSVPIRKLIGFPLIGIAVVGLCIMSLEWIGRDNDESVLESISVYLGAPLHNLDFAISRGLPKSSIFGQYTFRNLYPTLESLGLVDNAHSVSRFDFVSHGGYFMGNVYTLHYGLLVDFGLAGWAIAIAIMGFISQTFFEIAIRTINNRSLSIWPVIYGLVAYHLFMSYFSTNFYQNIFYTGFIKCLLGICIVIMYINHRSSTTINRKVV